MSTINTNLLAKSIHRTYADAQSKAAKASQSTATGNAIIRPADDAAGLAIGTGLKIDVSTLQTALKNSQQARSVLAVADGALKEIGTILERQKALSVQALSDSVTDNERQYLDLEFQSLVSEIDRMVGATVFNGKKLIDGSLGGGNNFATDVQGAYNPNDADAAVTSTAAITFTTAANDTAVVGGLIINGVTFDFAAANAADNGGVVELEQNVTGAVKAQNLAEIINNTHSTIFHSAMTQENRDRLSELSATYTGDILTITSKKSGAAGTFVITAGNVAGTTDHLASVAGGTDSFTVDNGALNSLSSSFDTGTKSGSLGRSSVTATGSMGDAILVGSTQTLATSGWQTIAAGDVDDGDVIRIFGRSFTLKNTVSDEATQIKRGSSTLLSAQNVATFLNNSEDPNIANFYYEARDNAGTIEFKATARAASTFYNAFEMAFDSTVIAIASGASAGINVAHITDNEEFIGTIDNFTAKLIGADQVKLSVTVGDYTYEANIADTTPAANTTVRMKSNAQDDKGGWFDLTFSTGGMAVATQALADSFAEKVNTAIKDLTFYQSREIASFDPSGTSIEETVVTMTARAFETTDVADIKVTNSRANNQEAALAITLQDGRVFENTADLNEGVTKGQLVELTNKTDSNEKITFIWGRDVDLSDQTTVEGLQADLLASFGANKTGMDFQVGIAADQVINVTIDAASTEELYSGEVLSIANKDSAKDAGISLDGAIGQLKSLRASIGSFQSRFDYAASNIETSIQNTDSARSVFLDADITKQSTELALAQVMMQASVSVLAQMNTLPQNLLKLIG